MDSIGTLKQEVLAHLQRSGRFAHVVLRAAFPPAQREIPLKNPVIAVGISGMELARGGFGGYYGTQNSVPLYGAGAKITLLFNVFVPPSGGAQQAGELFEMLCDVLLLVQNPFGITQIRCEQTVFDTQSGALHLPVWAQLCAAVSAADETAAVGQVVLRKD